MTHPERERKRKHAVDGAAYHQQYPPPHASQAPLAPLPPKDLRHGDLKHYYNGYVEYTTAPRPVAPATPRQTRSNRHHSARQPSRGHYHHEHPKHENGHHEAVDRPGKRHKTRREYTIGEASSEGELSDTGADVGEAPADDEGDLISHKFATFNVALADILLMVGNPNGPLPLLDRVLGKERSSFIKTMKTMQIEGTLPWLTQPRRAPEAIEGPKSVRTTCGLTLEPINPKKIRGASQEPVSRKVSGADSVRSVSTVASSVPPVVPFSSHSVDPAVKRAKIWPPELPDIHNDDIRRQVFSHRSIVDGGTSLIGSESLHNERLEFLGDSYLGAIVTRYIFSRFPTLREGAMTTIRSTIVGNKNLHSYGIMYKFDEKLIAGENKLEELLSRTKTVADLFEAYIGGLLLDRGPQIVDDWLRDLIEPMMKQITEEYNKEKPLNKAAKNEIARIIGGKSVTIDYRWTDGLGGNQGGYCYTIFFTGWGFTEKMLGSGWGPNKTDASIRAAMNVLEEKNALREVKRAKERWYEDQHNSQQHQDSDNSIASDAGTVIRHDIV
ncbi:hypothetical protein ABW19_dt0200631 [Dactylella cylindrospora]|nr:hypothetical protein ABW19_dt0200631 [Dactylella cylindrospora]